jgi:hypothetical protein
MSAAIAMPILEQKRKEAGERRRKKEAGERWRKKSEKESTERGRRRMRAVPSKREGNASTEMSIDEILDRQAYAEAMKKLAKIRPTKFEVRLASGGDQECYKRIDLITLLRRWTSRELPSKSLRDSQTIMLSQKEIDLMASRLGMSHIEVRAFCVAFFAFDESGNGILDAGELLLAWNSLSIYDRGMIQQAKEEKKEVKMEEFMTLCRDRWTLLQKLQVRCNNVFATRII